MRNRNLYETRYNLERHVKLWKLVTPYLIWFCIVGLCLAGGLIIMAWKESIDLFAIPQPLIGWVFITAPMAALAYWTFRKIKEINNQDHLNH